MKFKLKHFIAILAVILLISYLSGILFDYLINYLPDVFAAFISMLATISLIILIIILILRK